MGMQLSPSSPNLEEEFHRAYEEYADAIFRHCAFRICDRERGKELMQETFMKTWEYLAKGNEIDDVRPFLYKVATNLVLNDVRRRKQRKEISLEAMQEEGFDVEGEHGEDVQNIIDAKEVVSVLYQIKEPYRGLLIMRYIDGLKPSEIADLVGGSANTISVKLNRGMKYLRSILKNG